MATIEERAKVVFPNSTYLSSKQRRAYAIGATEQKAIDDAILLKLDSLWEENDARHNHEDEMHYKQGYHDAVENACEWLKEVFEGGGYVQDWQIDDFRTFMEESHK